jgi:hypothetical protein
MLFVSLVMALLMSSALASPPSTPLLACSPPPPALQVRTVAIAAWEKKLSAFRSIMIQEKVPVPGPEIEASPSFKPDGDILEALPAFLDPIEEDLQIHVNFKRQQTQLINEQIERIEVLKMCRELAIRAGRYNAVEDEVH